MAAEDPGLTIAEEATLGNDWRGSSRISDGSVFPPGDLPLMLPLMAFAWSMAWIFQDPFISDWDGFDYTAATIQGLPSALGLGRALFLGYNHLLWRLLEDWQIVTHESAYKILRYGAIALSGPAVAGLYALGRQLAMGRPAALAGAMILALSPPYILYSGRSMSEIPGFTALNWSLWLLIRSLRRGSAGGYLLSALALGLAANIREFAFFYIPMVVIGGWIFGQRWRAIIPAAGLAVMTSFSGMIFWYLRRGNLYLDTVINWYRLSAEERRLHPVTWQNLGFFGDYAYECSVAVVFLMPLALALLWPRRHLRPLLWLGINGLLADIALLTNHDLSLNPRYLLTGMTGLAPICGWAIAEIFNRDKLRAMALAAGIAVLTVITFIGISPDIFYQERNARLAQDYLDRVKSLPWNSAFIVGARSPLINFYTGIEAKPFWKTISPGAGWPDEKLEVAIDDLIIAGRIIYVDFDPEIWQNGAREWSREAAGLEMIRLNYDLQPIDATFYRILGKKTVTDCPNITAQVEGEGRLPHVN